MGCPIDAARRGLQPQRHPHPVLHHRRRWTIGEVRPDAQPEHGHPGVVQLRAPAVRAATAATARPSPSSWPRFRADGHGLGRRPTALELLAEHWFDAAGVDDEARRPRSSGELHERDRHAGRPAHRGRPRRRRRARRGADARRADGRAWPRPTRPSSPTPSRPPPASARRCRAHLADLFERARALSSTSPTTSTRRPRPASNPPSTRRRLERAPAPSWARIGAMKYVVCVPDGCADEPVRRAGWPHAARGGVDPRPSTALAARGEVGRAAVIPAGACRRAATSATCRSSATTPPRFHTGRAPIEAAALGLKLPRRPGRLPLQPRHRRRRRHDGRLRRRPSRPPRPRPRSSRPSTPRSGGGDGLEFHPGVRVPPHHGGPGRLGRRRLRPAPRPDRQAGGAGPPGPAAPKLQRRHGRLAARCWPRFGARRQPGLAVGPGLPAHRCRASRTSYGVDAGIATAVDLVRGLGVLTDIEVVDVEGATGWYDTDYEGKRDAALDGAGRRRRPVRRPRRGHRRGRPRRRRRRRRSRSLENWDRRHPRRPGRRRSTRLGPWRLLLLPDHATPLRLAHPHLRPGAVPAGRLRRSTAPAAPTPRPAWPTRRWSPATS